MPGSSAYLSIGAAAERSGVSTSALRFYESRGLIRSERGAGNQRRYHRSMLRRISVIRVAQSLGLTLAEIGVEFDRLPQQRTPTKRDWEKLSRRWQGRLDRQRQLLSLPEDQRPAPLKVTGEVLQGALRAVGAVVPPPTGPVLKLAAAVLDRAPDVRTATRGGDATDVIGVLEDTLVDAMKRSGLDERTAKAKLADLLEHLEDAFDD